MKKASVKAVAGGALVAVDFCSRYQVVSIGWKGWRVSQFLLDARMQWDAGQRRF